MERGTKRDTAVFDLHVPFSFEVFSDHSIKKFIEFINDFNESILHLFWGDSKFINESVYFVDE